MRRLILLAVLIALTTVAAAQTSVTPTDGTVPISVEGLKPGQRYEMKIMILATDEPLVTVPPLAPAQATPSPGRANVSASVTVLDPTRVAIDWSVGKPSTGVVNFGTTTRYGKTSLREDTFIYREHHQILRDLQPETTYHYRVFSKDEAGQTYRSADATFTTPKC